MDYKIIEINAEQTLEIRQKVMWPNKSIDYVRVEGDEQGQHFALLIGGKIVSIVSLFIDKEEAQFRKFATLVEFQGKGYGTVLLNKVFDVARQNKIQRIWCNARVDKCSFYERFGMRKTSEEFTKGGVDYLIMECLLQ